MGAIFVVEIARVESIAELPGERVALVADPSPPAQSLAGLAGPVTLLVGAEREGLPPDVVSACERTAHIPIEADSLNAAMAATVALYEMTRRGGRDHDTVTTK
jgi:TrmH family RNA methyltransferase